MRANGDRNPGYGETFVFTNDFSALRPDTLDGDVRGRPPPGRERARDCRVVCFSPRHDLTLGRMAPGRGPPVVDVWADQTAELGADTAGSRSSRTAARRWAPPTRIRTARSGRARRCPASGAREDAAQRGAPAATGDGCCSTTSTRRRAARGSIVESDEWLVVVPFWAAWPFETLVIPSGPWRAERSGRAARDDLARPARADRPLRRPVQRPFPYSMGWHQAPFGDATPPSHWQLHAHFYPPLLLGNVRKFMVGYELLAEPQRDLTPRTPRSGCARSCCPGAEAPAGAGAPAVVEAAPPRLAPTVRRPLAWRTSARTEARCGPGAGGSARNDERVAEFTRSIEVDAELAADDLAGSIAHVRGLGRAGLLTDDEVASSSTGSRRSSRTSRRAGSSGTRRSRTST